MDKKEYLIHITSGRGPAECCWVVTKVLSKVIADMKINGLVYEVISREKGIETGTLLSASIKASGSGIEHFISSWQGTIQWIGQSSFRKFHKRKNWFIGINCSAIAKSSLLSERDISYQTLRSGGPGGQHVNKVSTAVRAVHKPTGLSVTASDTRSQLQNKKLATQRLFELYQKNMSENLVREQQNIWNNHNSLIRGNPKRVFRGRDFMEVRVKEKQLE